jgi:beta-carotene 3-hydroxylase
MWIGAGVTAYGVAYIVVHDLYIHERLGRLPGAGLRYIRWVADAHGVHHRSGRGPYGFLLPRVPSASGRHPGHDPLEHTPRRSRRRQCETQPA